MSGIIDLSKLPPPDVVESLDYETILAERKAHYLSLWPVDQQASIAASLSVESEPVVKLMQANAYRELVWRQRVNDAARAVMLAYAKSSDLEHIAARYNTKRLVIVPADDRTVPPTPAVMEEDDDLRERTQMAFEGLSVAGPRGAYILYARSADGRVADASVISPAGAEVVVTVLSQLGDGSIDKDSDDPDNLLTIVRNALSDEDVRPVGDRLTVQSAAIVRYRIRAIIYRTPGPEAEPILAAARRRAAAYGNQRRRLGRDINVSAINRAIFADGMEKVILAEPSADIVLDKTQAAYCESVEIIDGGTSE